MTTWPPPAHSQSSNCRCWHCPAPASWLSLVGFLHLSTNLELQPLDKYISCRNIQFLFNTYIFANPDGQILVVIEAEAFILLKRATSSSIRAHTKTWIKRLTHIVLSLPIPTIRPESSILICWLKPSSFFFALENHRLNQWCLPQFSSSLPSNIRNFALLICISSDFSLWWRHRAPNV